MEALNSLCPQGAHLHFNMARQASDVALEDWQPIMVEAPRQQKWQSIVLPGKEPFAVVDFGTRPGQRGFLIVDDLVSNTQPSKRKWPREDTSRDEPAGAGEAVGGEEGKLCQKPERENIEGRWSGMPSWLTWTQRWCWYQAA